jgi:bacteriocin biosynthesis cyclodehydratase domain-containing protein
MSDAAQTRDEQVLIRSPRWVVRHVPGEAVYLLSERETVVIEDPIALECLLLIDGTRDADDVVAALLDADPAADLAAAYFRIEDLINDGHVLYAAQAVGARATVQAVGGELGLRASDIASRREHTIMVAGAGAAPDDVDAVVALLVGSGMTAITVNTDDVERVAADTACHHLLVITDDYAREALSTIDRARRAVGLPWMLAQPGLLTTWVGPVFRPGENACWHCLRTRVLGNREVERYLQIRTDEPPLRPATTMPGATRQFAAAAIAIRAMTWVLSPAPDADDDALVLTMSASPPSNNEHRVVRRPQCPECGVPTPLDALHPPVVPTGVTDTIANDSGTRSVTPEATYDRYKHQVSPITGAIRELTPLSDGLNPDMHVYAAGHNFAMLGHDLHRFRAGLRNNSSGKGMTDIQARVSAMGEALERFQGLYTGEEPRQFTTLDALGDHAIVPNDIMRFSDAQFDNRDAWNASGHRFATVPERFPGDQAVDWSPVWSLTHERVRWLPTAMLYFAAPQLPGRSIFVGCSNGCAAGNTREEAMLQGLLELIERDAVGIWWYNRLRRPAIDATAFDDPAINRMLEVYEALDRPVRFIDVTSDLGIPAVAAVSARRNAVTEDILLGFGAHLDPRIATMRALGEVVQFYPAVAPHAADGSGDYDYDDPESREWWSTARLETHPYLVPDDAAVPAPRAPGVGPVTDIVGAVEAVRARIEAAGHEVLILDQTRPDVGFPTVRMIAPGLRHFWARYAPGRLYDVPVQMGWAATPTPEDALNPTWMFL